MATIDDIILADLDAHEASKNAPVAPDHIPDDVILSDLNAHDEFIASKVNDVSFDPETHAAQNPEEYEAAYAVRKAKDARKLAEKLKDAGKVATEGGTYLNAAKGVGHFIAGLGLSGYNTAVQLGSTGMALAADKLGDEELAAASEQRALTAKAQATLAAQTIESGLKNTGRIIGNLANDTGLQNLALHDNFAVNPATGLANGTEVPVIEKRTPEEEEALRRADFDAKVKTARDQMTLASGMPLDEGAVAGIVKATQGVNPSEISSPEALKTAGADPVNPLMVQSIAAGADPMTLIFPIAGNLPGARKIAGSLVEGTGIAAQVPGMVVDGIKKIPGKIGKIGGLATGTASVGGAVEAIMHPVLATKIGAAVVASKGLQWFGKALQEQGGAMRKGVASSLDEAAAAAKLTGKSAKLINAQRVIGDTASNGVSTAIGMAPINALLSEGDGGKFADSSVGAGVFGGAFSLASSARPTLVEAARPFLRAKGKESINTNDQVGRQSAAFIDSLPEAQKNAAHELMGVFQGAPTVDAKGNKAQARLLVLDGPEYQAQVQEVLKKDQQAKIQEAQKALDEATTSGEPERIASAQEAFDAASKPQASAEDGGRGFFYGPDGTAYINGADASFSNPTQAAHTMGHEFAGHIGVNILRAMTSKGGPIYEGLFRSTAKGLLNKDGSPTPEFQKFIDGYNKKFGSNRLDASNPEAMHEYLAETAGQIVAGKGAAELAMPKGMVDKIQDNLGHFMGSLVGIDTRKIGGDTHFDRTELGSITKTVNDALSQIAGFNLREGGNQGVPAQTNGERIAELKEILAKPRPSTDAPASEVEAWAKEQKEAQAELKTQQAGLEEQSGSGDPYSEFESAPGQSGEDLTPHGITVDEANRLSETHGVNTADLDRFQDLGILAPDVAEYVKKAGDDAADAHLLANKNRRVAEATLDRIREDAEAGAVADITNLAQNLEENGIQLQHPLKDAVLTHSVNPEIGYAKWLENHPGAPKGSNPAPKPEPTQEAEPVTPGMADLKPENVKTGTTEEAPAESPESGVSVATMDGLSELGAVRGDRGIPATDASKEAVAHYSQDSVVGKAVRALAAGRGYLRWVRSYLAPQGEMRLTRAERDRDVKASPAKGRTKGTLQDIPVIPIEFFMRTSKDDAGPSLRVFRPDVWANNIEHILQAARKKGLDPFPGLKGKELDAALQDAMEKYVRNHARGATGAGDRMLKVPGPGFNLKGGKLGDAAEPLHTNPARAQMISDLLNMALKTSAKGKQIGKELRDKGIALNKENSGFNRKGELNKLRDALGPKVNDLLSSPFTENLRPDKIQGEVTLKSPAEDAQPKPIRSVRPLARDLDFNKIFEHGRPSSEAAAGGFMPKSEGGLADLKIPDERRNEHGFAFVSPNQGSMTRKEAAEALGGLEHEKSKAFQHKVAQFFAPRKSMATDAVGDWADGAENTVVTEFHKEVPYEDIRTAAAIMGAANNQKAVIPFKSDATGESILHDFTIPNKTLDEAAGILGKNGVENRTLIEVKDGVRVLVFDESGTATDSLRKFTQENNYDHTATIGRGEFLGSWETREEGLAAYRAAVEGKINSLGDQGREQDGAESGHLTGLLDLAKEAGLDLQGVSGLSQGGAQAALQNHGAGAGSSGPVRSGGARPQWDGKNITLTHWSRSPKLNETDPSQFGTAGAGAEKVRARDYKDLWIPRTYAAFGSYTKEGVIGDNRYSMQVKGSDLYDSVKDPLNLWPGIGAVEAIGESGHDWKAAQTLFEKRVYEAGYKGLVNTKHEAVLLFDKASVKPVEPGDKTLPETGGLSDLNSDVSFMPKGDKKDQTKGEGFKAWAGKAKLVRVGDSIDKIQSGKPVVIEGFHGTTHDFNIVNTNRTNPENDFGKGFYVSSNPRDVAANYAGEGPDLTSRLELKSEQIENDFSDPMVVEDAVSEGRLTEEQAQIIQKGNKTTHFGPEIDAARKIFKDLAKQELEIGAPSTMKVFVNLKNPLKLGGKEEFWDFEYPTEEQEANGEYEPTGKLVDFMQALHDVASRFDDADIVGDSLMNLQENGGATPSEVIKTVRESIPYATDPETGSMASSEIIRQALEKMGYDGIIDGTVDTKFGIQKRVGKPMEGMDPDTFHVIAFDGGSIKSATGNNGNFDTWNPDIRFMPHGERKVGLENLGQNEEKSREEIPQSSALRILYSPDSKLKAPEKGKIGNPEVASKLQRAAIDQWGGIVNSENIQPEQEQAIVLNGAAEAKEALKVSGHAGAWYTTAIKRAMSIAGVLHPELVEESAAQKAGFGSVANAKNAFALAMAITSQNLTVELNSRYADEQFNSIKTTGKFDTTKTYGEKAKSIRSNLNLANDLVEEFGWDRSGEFLNKDFTVKELMEAASEAVGREIEIDGKMGDLVQGSAIFGPKIGGGFFQNLIGNFNPVTVDLWMRRTWGRWTGDVLPDGANGDHVARMIDSARESGIELPELLKTVRPTERVTESSGRKTRTLSDAAQKLLLDNKENASQIYEFAKEVEAKWQKFYREIKNPITPEQLQKVRDGSLTLEGLNRQQQTINRRREAAWDGLKNKPTGKGAKAAYFAKLDARQGRTELLSNDDISDNKPEWASAAAVISNQLKPVDVPSNQDRVVINRIINKIRKEMEAEGHQTTNADIQAILWYPEKDIWAKLRGSKESNLKSSYDEEFLKIAEKLGLGDRARTVLEEAGTAPVERGDEPFPEAEVRQESGSPDGEKGLQGLIPEIKTKKTGGLAGFKL